MIIVCLRTASIASAGNRSDTPESAMSFARTCPANKTGTTTGRCFTNPRVVIMKLMVTTKNSAARSGLAGTTPPGRMHRLGCIPPAEAKAQYDARLQTGKHTAHTERVVYETSKRKGVMRCRSR
jgi:hypothetical protein